MIIGFFGYGYTVFVETNGEVGDLIKQVDHPMLIRAASFLAPIFAIAGGAMARSQNVAAGILLILASASIYAAFGFRVFTMFPIAMCLVGGMLALAARQPDSH